MLTAILRALRLAWWRWRARNARTFDAPNGRAWMVGSATLAQLYGGPYDEAAERPCSGLVLAGTVRLDSRAPHAYAEWSHTWIDAGETFNVNRGDRFGYVRPGTWILWRE